MFYATWAVVLGDILASACCFEFIRSLLFFIDTRHLYGEELFLMLSHTNAEGGNA